jgi:O-antigen ligase/polysaccharide polymerase Wzy-like membrane protein
MYFGLTGHNSLTSVSWALLISLMYGICGVGYGVLSGYSLVTALQILSCNLYPFYLFLGIWGGVQDPAFVRKYIRFFAWFGTAFIPIDIVLRNRSAVLFHSAVGTGFGVLLGIFAFEPRLRRYWLPIAVFSFSLIAHQVRGDWLGLAIALLVWGTATKNLGRIAGMIAVIGTLLIVGAILDVHLRALPGRGGELSTRETASRALSAVSPELAMEYSSNARAYAGTVSWRKSWWKGIREAVSENYQTMMFGLGYGFPIYTLGQGELRTTKSGIRSPHNIFYFVLAYSGVVGLICLFGWKRPLLFCFGRLTRSPRSDDIGGRGATALQF